MNIKVTVGEEWNGLKWLRVIFNGGSFMLNSSNLDVLFSDINCFLLQFTCLLTPWSRGLPEKLTGPQLVRNSTIHYRVHKSPTLVTIRRICPIRTRFACIVMWSVRHGRTVKI